MFLSTISIRNNTKTTRSFISTDSFHTLISIDKMLIQFVKWTHYVANEGSILKKVTTMWCSKLKSYLIELSILVGRKHFNNSAHSGSTNTFLHGNWSFVKKSETEGDKILAENSV